MSTRTSPVSRHTTPVRRSSRRTTVRDFMTSSPHTIGRDQPLAAAHALMRVNGLRHLPVLEGGKLVGVVSQRDLYFIETIRGVDPNTDQVDDAMTQEAFEVTPDVALEEVVARMEDKKLGSAVVMARGKVVGIFTTTDALRALSALLRERN